MAAGVYRIRRIPPRRRRLVPLSTAVITAVATAVSGGARGQVVVASVRVDETIAAFSGSARGGSQSITVRVDESSVAPRISARGRVPSVTAEIDDSFTTTSGGARGRLRVSSVSFSYVSGRARGASSWFITRGVSGVGRGGVRLPTAEVDDFVVTAPVYARGRSVVQSTIINTSTTIVTGRSIAISSWAANNTTTGGIVTVIPSGLRPSWTFIRGTEVYAFPVNPNKGGSPAQVLQTSTSPSSAADGTILVWQGRAEVPKSQFSGVILSQDQHDALVNWFGKPSEAQMIDDLGRSMSVWITNLSLKRAPRQHFPWRHTYTCDYVLISPSAV